MRATANSATPTTSLTRRESAATDPDTLYLHDHWKHHRTPARALAQEPPQLDANLFVNQSRIGALLDAGLGNHHRNELRSLGHHRIGFGVSHHAARDELGHTLHRTGLPVDGDHGHD